MSNVQESIQKIATKTGKPVTEVQTIYDSHLSSLPPNISGDAKRQKYAIKLTNRDCGVNTKSPAVAFEGCIIGAGETRDMMAGIWAKAVEDYQKDQAGTVARKEIAIIEGVVTPLETKKTWPSGDENKNFGKPKAKHAYVKDLIMAVRQPGETAWTAGKMRLRGDQCSVNIPFGKIVDFKSLGELVNGEYALRSSVTTQFTLKGETTPDQFMEILDTAFPSHTKDLGECLAYHQSLVGTPGFFDRYVITEGTVAYIKFPDDDSKNIMIVLNDDSLTAPIDGITIWLPNKFKELVNFGRQSVVTVVAQTREGKLWDRQARAETDVPTVSLNGFSIFGRPGLTTIAEEAEIL
jgi:hypothetical protein